MSEVKRTEQEVLSVYQKVNPSTYPIENDIGEYKRRMDFMENLFLHRLCFPPKMFENANILEFGTGTGEHSLFFLHAGASCTFVEMNQLACQRAEALFDKYYHDPSKYKIVNKSFFDFSSNDTYDIVISLGVIHHTANKEAAFGLKAKHLKKGGFLILGIANSAGFFQRNLQRSIIYNFAKTEKEIESLAEELFHKHLDRAEKYGKRDRKAIIYDSYVNPKIDAPSVSEVISWFSQHSLKMYSSWPPILPAILGDPANRKPLQFDAFPGLMSIPEIVYLTHSHDDASTLIEFEKEADKVITPFKELVDLFNNVTPCTSVKFDDAIRKIDSLQVLGASNLRRDST